MEHKAKVLFSLHLLENFVALYIYFMRVCVCERYEINELRCNLLNKCLCYLCLPFTDNLGMLIMLCLMGHAAIGM
jgi:hypothetical protein